MKTKRSQLKGFSLVELLLVMVLLAILAISASAVSIRFVGKQQINSDTNVLTSQLYLAQTNAQTGKNNSAWGVRVDSGTVIVFAGSSFAGRNAELDIIQAFGRGTNVTGAIEVIFNLHSGFPLASSDITIYNTQSSNSININEYGTISYST